MYVVLADAVNYQPHGPWTIGRMERYHLKEIHVFLQEIAVFYQQLQIGILMFGVGLLQADTERTIFLKLRGLADVKLVVIALAVPL